MTPQNWKRNISNVRKEVMVTLLIDKGNNDLEFYQESYYYYGRLSRIELIKAIEEEHDNYVIVSINHF